MFRLCQREFLLEVFKQDATEKQREYLMIGSKIPDAVPLCQWIKRVRYLSRAIQYLLCLADLYKTLPDFKRMDKLLSEIELCSTIMRVSPVEWQDKYALNNSVTPTDNKKLLAKLEKIKTVVSALRKYRIKVGGKRIPKRQRPASGNRDLANRNANG